MTSRIQRNGLHVRSSGDGIAVPQAKGAGACSPERPARFDGAGNDWQNQNMSYLCRAIFLSVKAKRIKKEAEKRNMRN